MQNPPLELTAADAKGAAIQARQNSEEYQTLLSNTLNTIAVAADAGRFRTSIDITQGDIWSDALEHELKQRDFVIVWSMLTGCMCVSWADC